MSKVKTRGIFIKRKIRIVNEDAKGKVTEKVEVKEFPCQINASVPPEHKMCENSR